MLNWVLNVTCLFVLIIFCLQVIHILLMDYKAQFWECFRVLCSYHIFFISSKSIIFNFIVIESLYFSWQVKIPLCSKLLKLLFFLRFKETTRSFSNECLGTTRPVTPIDSSDFALDIRMPGVTPKQVRGILYFIIQLFYVQFIIKAKKLHS